MRSLFVALFLCVCCCTSYASSPEPGRDIQYTVDRSGPHKGDLFLPLGSGPFPAIIFLHGGAWRSGNKGSFSRLAADLAKDGYAGFSINYDLSAHSFPLAWEETRAAIRFLRAHSAEYHLDPNRIVVAGTSAGGELAALAALAPEGPAENGNAADRANVPVSAAIILNGVFDLCFPHYVIKRYLGGSCTDKKAVYDDASPLRHVHPDAPAFFVGHGTKDHVVPYLAAEIFVNALRKDGVPVTVARAENGPHMYWQKKSFYDGTLHDIETFLSTTLSTPTSTTPGAR